MPLLLSAVGLLVWLLAGSTSLVAFASAGRPGLWPWLACYLAFGVLLIVAVDSRRWQPLRLAALAGQSGVAVALAFLGMPAFEGALLALVVAQAALLLPLWAALSTAIAQVLPLWAALERTYRGVEIFKSVSSYLGFSTFAVISMRLFEAERRAGEQLDQTVRELVATRALLAENARVAERARITREIHDLLGHHLVALSMQLDSALQVAEPPTRATLEHTRELARRAIAAVREAVRDRNRNHLDLGAALRATVADWGEPRVELAAPEVLVVHDPGVALAALRCVQEALTNSAKHAAASLVRVTVEVGEHLVIVVTDDGRGAEVIRPGQGLRGMRERVEAAGGDLAITVVPGGGTTVQARFPASGLVPDARRAAVDTTTGTTLDGSTEPP